MYGPKQWPWHQDVGGTWFQNGFGSVHVVNVGSQVLPRIKHYWMTPTKASPNHSLLIENVIGENRLAYPISFDNASVTFHEEEMN